jgi:deaminated glutathione amidase
MSTVRVALIQLRSGRDPLVNLEAATALIREAKAAGATYVQTPEMTNILEADRARLHAVISPEETCPVLAGFRDLARETGLTVHVGSLAIKTGATRAANRAFVIAPTGEIVARYDKIHMFDVDLANGESYRESDAFQHGEHGVLVDLPFGRLGLSICYDMRFPHLYRALAEGGAQVLTAPAAFTRQTGEAHWHILLRARAIENGAFMLAAAQGGTHDNNRQTYGHSLIVDPWGRVLAEGGTEPGVILADLDLDQVALVRKRIPALANGRRFDVGLPKGEPHLHVVGGTSA